MADPADSYRGKFIELLALVKYRPQKSECVIKNNCFHFSAQTYIMDTQENRLNETILMNTQHIFFKPMDMKIIAIYTQFFLLNET